METPDAINPYSPPNSALDVARPTVAAASLDDAIAGRYDFKIGEVLSEAWKLTDGFKASFWGAALVIGVIYFVVSFLGGLVFGRIVTGTPSIVSRSIFNGVIGIFMAPLSLGLQMMSVQRALGRPVSFSTAFSYFPKAPTALAAAVLVMLTTYVGFALLVIPGIYLSLAYSMTSSLIGEHPLPAWRAMETSRKAVSHKWFRVFGMAVVVVLIVLVSGVALLIPLFWTLPFAMLSTGVLYRRMFHATPVAPSSVQPAP